MKFSVVCLNDIFDDALKSDFFSMKVLFLRKMPLINKRSSENHIFVFRRPFDFFNSNQSSGFISSSHQSRL